MDVIENFGACNSGDRHSLHHRRAHILSDLGFSAELAHAILADPRLYHRLVGPRDPAPFAKLGVI